MSTDSNDPKGPDDPTKGDRAAILARRQHFIALALSGLASTACVDGKTEAGGQTTGKSGPKAKPEPCLDMPAPTTAAESQGSETPDPEPQVCLKIAAPEPDETGESGETGGSETGEPPPVDPAPRPCLKKVAPQPCLKKPAPRPCLRKKAPDPPEEL